MDFSFSLPSQTVAVVAIVVVLYLLLTFFFGMYFSRFNSNINDFFFSGKRLSWWLPMMSLVATGIGSYSYLKYSEQGFNTGMSSSHVYFNDWFLFPVFLFGWLPILYFNRIQSIPEYFEKRFNSLARYLSVCIILGYIFYYIGFNLFTIGLAVQGIFGISPLFSLPVITLIIAVYVTFGGQTAVVFTDLVQGLILYFVGFLIVGCGLYALGGIGEFWSFLPETHRMPLAELKDNHKYNTVGIFWGDAIAGSVAFLYMNQGFLMRFLTIRSISQTQKAALANICITLPLSALVVGGTGWLARSIISKQKILGSSLGESFSFLDIQNSYHTFLQTAYVVIQQNDWILGLIFAALMAALMSTIDSLITAASAIGIYDIYKPLIRPKANDKHYLKMARWTSAGTAVLGLLLVVWFFGQKGTLMSIHYKGIMLIIPPVVTTVFLGVLWRKFHAFSACVGMSAGILAIFLSMIFPQPVYWLRELLLGASGEEIIYFRAPFGICVTALVICIVQMIFPDGQKAFHFFSKKSFLSSCFSAFTQGSSKNVDGLTVDTLKTAMFQFKGKEPRPAPGGKAQNLVIKWDSQLEKNEICLSSKVCKIINAEQGDLIYLSDQRWF